MQSSLKDSVNFEKRLKNLKEAKNEVRNARVKLFAGLVLGEKRRGRPRKQDIVEDVLDEPPQFQNARPLNRPKPKFPAKRKIKPPKRKEKRIKLRDEKPMKESPLFKFGFAKKKK